MSSKERNRIREIEQFFQSRKEVIREVRHKMEVVKEVYKTSDPYASTVATMCESYCKLFEDQCDLDSLLFTALISTHDNINVIWDWIDYLKTITSTTATTKERKNAREKGEALEERLKALEAYKPVLEHLRKWVQREKQQLGLV